MATALRYIGYDAFVLGNHEFNYAPQIQWNYFNLLTSTDKAVVGQPVDVICSNVVETETNESVFSRTRPSPTSSRTARPSPSVCWASRT